MLPEKMKKAIQIITVMEEFQSIIGAGIGLDSEEEMINDMSDFCKKRLFLEE